MRTDLSLPCALPSLLFIFHLQTLITHCSPFSLSTPPINHCFDHHCTAHHHRIPHLSSSLHNLHLPPSLALFLSRTPAAFDPSPPHTLPTSPTPIVSSLCSLVLYLYIYIYISCMDSWESSLRPSRHRPTTGNSRATHHPSFSSSLLDAIYRSIDEGEDNAIGCATKEEEELAMFKEKLAARRPAAEEKLVRRFADYDAFHRRRTPSASSSSGSSYGGLSSSESESASYRAMPAANKAPPAKTFMEPFDHRRDEKASSARKEKKKQVSPSARIAGFLNSLLGSAKTAKKAKLSSAPPNAAESPSPSLSSASSRSCLSKYGGGGGSGKRSVRFYPVSVIVDEDCRPCGQKSLHDPSPVTTRYLSEELKVHIMENNERVEEAADRILNRYQTRTEILLRRESWAAAAEAMLEEEEEDVDDCDAASYASSDLFELENLGVIGGERYREELPVYETTNVVTNRVIAHGLIL